MDYYSMQGSAIDRAFAAGTDSHVGLMQDLSNAAPPMPRKRPTAKPASSASAKPASGSESLTDSPAPESLPAKVSNGSNANSNKSPAFTTQPQSHPQNPAATQQEIQALREQLAEVPTDPAQQAHMMARMTGLMNELQSMMAQMARMSVPPNAPQQQQPPQQQQQQQSQQQLTPTSQNPPSTFDHFSDDFEAQTGLRSTAKPFEPVQGNFNGRGGGGGFGGSNFAGGSRGGFQAAGGQQQRYAPVSNAGGNPYSQQQQQQQSNPWGSAFGNNNGGMGAMRPQGCVICFVEFKRGRMKRYESDVFIAPGNYIIVEGDRGEDCGLVVHTFQRLPDGSTGRSETLEGVAIDTSKVKPETGRVRRVANEHEVDRLHGEIATLERMALKTCRERVETMGLEMDVVDCEYQFDRKKITFFFDAPRAIDFRELTKDLFKHFGARIWLENINSKVKNVVPEGALSHADKLLYAERGLRPPRR